jgi:integrase
MGKIDYLKQYESKNTVRCYEASLKDFFKMVYGEREPLEGLAERYFSEKRNYEEDMQNFLVEIKSLAPKTVKLKLSAIKTFLLENGVELSQMFWRRLGGRVKGSRALTLDKVPSNVELRKIMMHLPIQGKALFLMLESSGMRIGECLRIKPEDLDLESDPVRVNIRGEYTKTGNSRVTFISREAGETVREWVKVRKEYLDSASARSRYDKSTDDSRLFPFTEGNARVMWNLALKKTGNGKRDQQTNIHESHVHVLRKFFRSRMGTVIQADIVECLLGHEEGLTSVYRRYSTEDLAKFYKEGEHTLLVFTEAGEVSKLKQEIEERNKQLQQIVNGLVSENMAIKTDLEKVKLDHAEMKRKVEAELAELKKLLQK